MIIGHGIDLQEIDSIAKAYTRNAKFAKRVLTEKEFSCFLQQKSSKRQMEFLSGRWAAKEAFAKAFGTGIGAIGFKDIEILNNDLGAPIITQPPFEGNCFVSISHTGNFVQASVILEDER